MKINISNLDLDNAEDYYDEDESAKSILAAGFRLDKDADLTEIAKAAVRKHEALQERSRLMADHIKKEVQVLNGWIDRLTGPRG